MAALKTIRSYLFDSVGALAPMAAVMLPLLLGLTGVGIEVLVPFLPDSWTDFDIAASSRIPRPDL